VYLNCLAASVTADRDRVVLTLEAQQQIAPSVERDAVAETSPPSSREVETLLGMQRTLGNQAVQRYIQRVQASAAPSQSPGLVLQRTTVVAKDGVEHSEDPSSISTDETGVTHDAAGNVVTFRAPDGAWVEEPDASQNRSPSPDGAAQSGSPDQTAAPGSASGTPKSVADMTTTEKLVEAYNRAPINAAVRQKILSLMTPEALAAAIISFAAVFVVSQFTPVGWAADLGIALTAVFVGTALFTAIEHLIRFADAANATTPEELDQAGKELAQAAAEIEVDAIILLLTHGAGGGPRGGVPYEGPPPQGLVLATAGGRVLVPVAAETISAEVAAQLGIRAAVATGPMMSRASGSRDFEPPARDNTGKVHSPPGEDIPITPDERQTAIESWSREELESAAEELEQSIAGRQAEQQRLGEDSVGPNGQRTGAQHRVRIQNEEALLRAIRKKLSGT
jgi:hypothetical protein